MLNFLCGQIGVTIIDVFLHENREYENFTVVLTNEKLEKTSSSQREDILIDCKLHKIITAKF